MPPKKKKQELVSTKLYTVIAEFTLDDNFAKYTKRIEKAAGKCSDGSGAGFGIRDLSFCDLSLTTANKICKVISPLKIPGLHVVTVSN